MKAAHGSDEMCSAPKQFTCHVDAATARHHTVGSIQRSCKREAHMMGSRESVATASVRVVMVIVCPAATSLRPSTQG